MNRTSKRISSKRRYSNSRISKSRISKSRLSKSRFSNRRYSKRKNFMRRNTKYGNKYFRGGVTLDTGLNFLRDNVKPRERLYLKQDGQMVLDQSKLINIPVKVNIVNPDSEHEFSIDTHGFSIIDLKDDIDLEYCLENIEKTLPETPTATSRQCMRTYLNKFNQDIEYYLTNHLPLKDGDATRFNTVVAVDAVYRNTDPAVRSPFGAVSAAHIDFSTDESATTIINSFGDQWVDKLRYNLGPVAQLANGAINPDIWGADGCIRLHDLMNVWISLTKGGIKGSPLAVMDVSTMDAETQVIPYIASRRIREGQEDRNPDFTAVGIKHKEENMWYHYPEMKPGKAWFFKSAYTPHSAFQLPETNEPRQSMECRVLLLDIDSKKLLEKSTQYLRVMSWNILARGATKYHFESRVSENESQTEKRYNKIMSQIVGKNPDIVLLQEVDYIFFMSFKLKYWNDYDIIFSQFPGDNVANESFGTAMIFKKGKFKNKITYEYIDSLDKEEYGYKNALILNLIDNRNRPMVFITTHLSGSNVDTAVNLLNKIKDKLDSVSDTTVVVMGGDFNCDLNNVEGGCGEGIRNIVERDMDLKRSLQETAEPVSTCSFDYSDTKDSALIDQIYYNNLNELNSFVDKTMECDDRKIWDEGSDNIYYPSDHFPIISDFIIT